ncbi:MAG: hypothetical protein A2096_07675 [Spirochaetes bacterium GWF1_41_5]|nr:MAG: hypothetical protein A2096_07675 [Spirochaetes bacterium GWF1_41_5]HBE01290.1 hypothetical protein [Spirochaetia bacterium]
MTSKFILSVALLTIIVYAKKPNQPGEKYSYIIGKLEHQIDITGAPKMFGICEYKLVYRNIATKKEDSIYVYSKSPYTDPKYFIKKIIPGKYEIVCLEYAFGKFPIYKCAHEELPRENPGYKSMMKLPAVQIPVNKNTRVGVSLSAGPAYLDCTKGLEYNKYEFEVAANSYVYIGNLIFPLVHTIEDYQRIEKCFEVKDELADPINHLDFSSFIIDTNKIVRSLVK